MYTYRISFSPYYFLISMKHYFFLLVEIESAHARDTEMIDFTFAEARLNTNQLIKMFQYSFVHLFFFFFFFFIVEILFEAIVIFEYDIHYSNTFQKNYLIKYKFDLCLSIFAFFFSFFLLLKYLFILYINCIYSDY